ncbi:MAG: molybdopterin-guanine dinucleotide biosynthesis protein MobA [Epsilonproteobacteria bacterium (ex Lamellibrachia satsuma)]|nr:MAG: molybdopterin-guanine dinucleotide biosynthesis protein MobA [Epsilonproteobacteria bacterium (ex Lamellibrachia satsuma)]
MKYNIPAILFAGGKSSRMGKDKALLPFAGHNTLSEFQYSRLSNLFQKVYLSAKEDKFDFDALIILDRYEESSPLVGIVSLFETLKEDRVFILSVDAPFVNERVIEALLNSKENFDAVIAQSSSGTQPLCGVYNRSILPLAQKHLNEGKHRLNHLLKAANTQFISFENDSLFMNINHPHEYEDALLFCQADK